MSVDLDRLKKSFSTVAVVYDSVRPGYPAAVAGRILAFFPAPRAISILEVGCGSGQATTLFASTGAQIVAIDISTELVALAKQRLADFPNVRFQVSDFETFESETALDLVYSAQAFHWIPTTVGLPHAANLLKPGGRHALFWNFFRYDSNATLEIIRDIIVQHIPLFARYPEGSAFEFDSFKTQWVDELTRSGLFKNVSVEIVETTRSYSFQEYLELVSSFSWFQTQPETIQNALVAELRDSFESSVPRLVFPVQTLLIIAENNKN